MFSGLIPGLLDNSIRSPDDQLRGRIPAIFQRLLNLTGHHLTFIRRKLSDSGVSGESSTVLIWSSSVLVVMPILASLSWLLYSKKKKKKRTNGGSAIQTGIAERTGESPVSGKEVVKWSSLYDALVHDSKGDIVPISDANSAQDIVQRSDAEYADDLQVQEALLASLFTSQTANNASSSIMNPNSLMITSKESSDQTETFCEICFENKPTWQMFDNPTCSHSFCYDCTGKHIVSKIQDNIKVITCPGLNCSTVLDFNVCRSIIPNDILVKWDESLCKSLILESQKVYCPFTDCSVMLVNDSSEVITEIKCPLCQRLLCASCRVPWHSEFTCQEFQKMNAKKKGREELMVATLAKKKHWRKCPRCKFYVEKTEGCLHITCRCCYEFCYRCGSKWSTNHGGCKQRS